MFWGWFSVLASDDFTGPRRKNGARRKRQVHDPLGQLNDNFGFGPEALRGQTVSMMKAAYSRHRNDFAVRSEIRFGFTSGRRLLR